ncbi:hypothetical protein C2845_PM07G01670 [Panicum miliaceum]|uniref:Uncharacterized protein n=1 Tax=Panicum miliaceum TaxID=4540 RepID=A0A3L6SGF2_PANMI|nr:hypothetical protein C2845_PM07G01670 [Panicum miliaceum]
MRPTTVQMPCDFQVSLVDLMDNSLLFFLPQLEDSNVAQCCAMSTQHSNVGAVSFVSIDIPDVLPDLAAGNDLQVLRDLLPEVPVTSPDPEGSGDESGASLRKLAKMLLAV